MTDEDDRIIHSCLESEQDMFRACLGWAAVRLWPKAGEIDREFAARYRQDRAPCRSPPVVINHVLVFTIVALTLLMMSVDSTIVATVLHALQHGLDTSVNWAGWTLTAYFFGFVVMLPISGRLSEQYGRRRVFLGSVVVFTVASLLCGLADNIFVLIALRALQAAGGAGFTPSATGIIVDHFGDEHDIDIPARYRRH